MSEQTITAFEGVLLELARSRGIESIEELVSRVNEAGYAITVEELREDGASARLPRPGYGIGVAEVLGLNEAEMMRLASAFVKTFM